MYRGRDVQGMYRAYRGAFLPLAMLNKISPVKGRVKVIKYSLLISKSIVISLIFKGFLLRGWSLFRTTKLCCIHWP